MAAGFKAGCGGFPVSRPRYFTELEAVEITSSSYNPPKLATAQKWREEAPAGFEYSLCAWQLITHPATHIAFDKLSREIPERRRAFCGHFKDTPEVSEAWEATRAVAGVLRARFVVFATPSTFYPDANHLKDMYRFFKAINRGGLALVWQPEGEWTPRMVEKICADLGLIHGVDPLKGPSVRGGVYYYRLPGLRQGRGVLRAHRYSDAELRQVLELAQDKPGYAFFSNLSAWQDAKRLVYLSRGGGR